MSSVFVFPVSCSLFHVFCSYVSWFQFSGAPSKISILTKQMAKIYAAGGFENIVPSEGLVFMYKNKVYKLTGLFAPINQITGLLKFGR